MGARLLAGGPTAHASFPQATVETSRGSHSDVHLRTAEPRLRLEAGLGCASAHAILSPWSKGGRTSVHNGALLCPYHHHRAHEPANDITRLANGKYTFTDGRRPADHGSRRSTRG
ncbi:MAG: hypothetical protein ACRDPJ_22095 [Nocardioidaceae bacterium]